MSDEVAGDTDIEAAKQAIKADAGAERGNDVTHESADDKVADGSPKGATPARDDVRAANVAGSNPERT